MTRFHRGLWLCGGFFVLLTVAAVGGQDPLPPFADIEKTVHEYFEKDRSHREEDLITCSQVAEILQSIKKLGWEVPDEKKLLDDALEESHILVRTMQTPAGRKFLSKVASRDLIYDRFDRISEVSGGPELIRDIVKLPNGEKYAKPRSGGGVPDLLDLLPKNASGKTRRIADYDSPTGHIYTIADLLTRLKEAYAKSQQKTDTAPAKSSAGP